MPQNAVHEAESMALGSDDADDFLDFMEDRCAHGESIRDRQVMKLVALARAARQDQARFLWLRAHLRPELKLIRHPKVNQRPAHYTLVAGKGPAFATLEECIDAEQRP